MRVAPLLQTHVVIIRHPVEAAYRVTLFQQQAAKVEPDEAGAAGNQNTRHESLSNSSVSSLSGAIRLGKPDMAHRMTDAEASYLGDCAIQDFEGTDHRSMLE